MTRSILVSTIAVLALLAAVTAKNCPFCIGVIDCQTTNVRSVTCDADIAQRTIDSLQAIYRNISEIVPPSDTYGCVQVKHIPQWSAIETFHTQGCIYGTKNLCNQDVELYGNFTCSYQSSARLNTYSSVTMIATAVAWLLQKL